MLQFGSQLAVNIRTVLADVHGRLGDYPHVITEYDAAQADLAAMGREWTSVAANVQNNLGVILMNAGLLARAGQVLEQSRATTRGASGEDAINPAVNPNLAGTWLVLGRITEAVELLEGALDAARRAGNTRFVGYSAGKAVRRQIQRAHALYECRGRGTAVHGRPDATEWLGSALLVRATVLASKQNDAATRTVATEAVDQLQQSMGTDAPPTREARALPYCAAGLLAQAR